MATIGLDRLYYAKITENDAGEETYGTAATPVSSPTQPEVAHHSVTPIWNFAIWMPTVPTTSTYRFKTSSIL